MGTFSGLVLVRARTVSYVSALDSQFHIGFTHPETVATLMAKFHTISVAELDREGSGGKSNSHFFGVETSVLIGVERMNNWCDGVDADEGGAQDFSTQSGARSLLAALSVLHEGSTPQALFHSCPCCSHK